MVPVKKDTPHVPVTPNEIIEQTQQAYEIGITIVHLHARAEDEQPTYKKSVYQEIFEGVKKHCPGLIICGSTSGRNFPEFEKRSEVIELKPDMCSLTLSSLNFANQASVNPPDMIVKLATVKSMVTPEFECFDMGMLIMANISSGKEYHTGPFYWNLLFAILRLRVLTFKMGMAINEIPASHLCLCRIEASQLKVNASAIAMGYGVEWVEDIWWDQAKPVGHE
jgi:uncharacterized protein (DUF849 family)